MDDLSRYGRTQRSLEWAGIIVFALLTIYLAQRIEITKATPIVLVVAWLAADLLSGIAHWAFDRFGSVHTPVFGPAFIRPFREHHVDPAAMTRHDFVETNGSSCLACLPFLGLAFVLPPEFSSFIVFLSMAILMTNQCHKWAHMPSRPGFVSLLQKMNLVLKPEVHERHHRPPFSSHYCTASGWLNPVLNKILR